MALGTFKLIIRGERIGGEQEDPVKVRLVLQGRDYIIDQDGEKFIFPHLSAGNPQRMVLPITLDLPTDVPADAGPEVTSENIGFDLYIEIVSTGVKLESHFAARAADSEVYAHDLTESVVTPVSDLTIFLSQAEEASETAVLARDEAVAARDITTAARDEATAAQVVVEQAEDAVLAAAENYPVITWDGSAYRPRATASPSLFIGPADPNALGLMNTGDLWANTDPAATSQTERTFEGTGSPEGVFAAPVGTMWRDTAITNGAQLWMKRTGGSGTSGWRVVYGDTGLRDLRGSIVEPNEALASWVGAITVRRINDIVFWNFGDATTKTNIAADRPIIQVPTGFRPTTAFHPLIALNINQYGLYPMRVFPSYHGTYPSWLSTFPAIGATALRFSMAESWMTLDPWPTTLPGV